MRTIMAIVNQYDEIVVELERDGRFFWQVPIGDRVKVTTSLDEGDVFRVEEITIED